MSPESPPFYLASDGEIQINSCQSGGPQGEGLRRWGEGGLGEWEICCGCEGEVGVWRGQGLTDGGGERQFWFIHRFITYSCRFTQVGALSDITFFSEIKYLLK